MDLLYRKKFIDYRENFLYFNLLTTCFDSHLRQYLIDTQIEPRGSEQQPIVHLKIPRELGLFPNGVCLPFEKGI